MINDLSPCQDELLMLGTKIEVIALWSFVQINTKQCKNEAELVSEIQIPKLLIHIFFMIYIDITCVIMSPGNSIHM